MSDQQPNEGTLTRRIGVAEALHEMGAAEWPKMQACATLLLKLLGNIEREPTNGKFRMLNPGNARLSKDLFSVYGCEAFLHSVGFRKQWGFDFNGHGHRFVLNDDSLTVSWAVEELQVFLEAEGDKQQRRERDARIARERAAEAQSRAWRPSRRGRVLATEAAMASAPAIAPGNLDHREITFTVQTLTQATDMKVSKQATLGNLRASLAITRSCRPDQVKLALLSNKGDSTQLIGDHRNVEVCEITDGCVICVSFTNADEFQGCVSKVDSTRKSKGFAFETLDKLARETSWKFTQEILASAMVLGVMDNATAKPLKRKMHTGELSMKEVRDQIIADAGVSEDGCSPFQHIIDKYLSSADEFEGKHHRIFKTCSVVEDNWRYAQMIANENARGLMEASKRMTRK
mmetsp:Transcript_137836/g.243049  ORF Transcript_137836/g.243049 Transcript_137836/m.243049 type:complete len:403 (-) Transcript_137836:149-1357(-)